MYMQKGRRREKEAEREKEGEGKGGLSMERSTEKQRQWGGLQDIPQTNRKTSRNYPSHAVLISSSSFCNLNASRQGHYISRGWCSWCYTKANIAGEGCFDLHGNLQPTE